MIPAISAGARKMPLPIIEPMMIMVASSSRSFLCAGEDTSRTAQPVKRAD